MSASAEVDVFRKSLLSRRWPNSVQLGHFRDIRERIIEELLDASNPDFILCAGFVPSSELSFFLA